MDANSDLLGGTFFCLPNVHSVVLQMPDDIDGSSHLGGEQRVRMRGGEGRSGQVTPPVWRSTRSL